MLYVIGVDEKGELSVVSRGVSRETTGPTWERRVVRRALNYYEKAVVMEFDNRADALAFCRTFQQPTK